MRELREWLDPGARKVSSVTPVSLEHQVTREHQVLRELLDNRERQDLLDLLVL